jgi:hypothetical protein
MNPLHSLPSSRLLLCLPSGLFLSGFLTKSLCARLVAPMRAIHHAHLDDLNNIWRGAQIEGLRWVVLDDAMTGIVAYSTCMCQLSGAFEIAACTPCRSTENDKCMGVGKLLSKQKI